MKLHKGFTLVELMVVVAIVAILATVSMPMYTNYVIRGKVPGATSNLSIKRTAMEQYFQDNRSYDAGGGACPANVVPDNSSQYFSFTCIATPATYTITATGVTGQSMDGFTYTIDQSNAKTTTIVAPAPVGWQATSACWITKPGGGC